MKKIILSCSCGCASEILLGSTGDGQVNIAIKDGKTINEVLVDIYIPDIILFLQQYEKKVGKAGK